MILLPFISHQDNTSCDTMCFQVAHVYMPWQQLHQEPKFAWHFIPHGVCMAYLPMSSQTVLNVSLNCKILYAFPMFPMMFQQFSHITHIQSLTLFHIYMLCHTFLMMFAHFPCVIHICSWILSQYFLSNTFLMMFLKFQFVIHLCSLILSNMFCHMFLMMFPKFSYVIYSCSLIFRQYVLQHVPYVVPNRATGHIVSPFGRVSKRGAFWEQWS
jgi:hypothetical protein